MFRTIVAQGRSPPLAPNGPPAMSAVRSLSGVERTCRSSRATSGFDPGCVKTCTSQECAELFSLSSSLSGGRKHFWFSNLRNRDGISTRRLNVGVFTRPRPKADLELPDRPFPDTGFCRYDD